MNDVPENASSIVNSILDIVEKRDPLTYEHCLRVGQYSRVMAQFLGLNEYDQAVAEFSGMLHDVGKIMIPGSVIHKAGPLDDREFQAMKNHPLGSASTLSPYLENEFFQNVLPGILHHHERFDGRGYPDRLEKENIPLMARIVAMVDTLDAITQTRSYRKHQSFDYMISEVHRCSGTQFCPQVAKVFLETQKFWNERVEETRKTLATISLNQAA